MAYTQPYTAYKETGVRTASQGTLVIMLYTEAVKHLDGAITLFTKENKILPKNIEVFHKHLSKTQEIITELMVSLDMEKGGSIAKNLMNLYTFFNQTLMNASINKEKNKIAKIRKMVNDLRETWVTISSQASAPTPQSRPNIDING